MMKRRPACQEKGWREKLVSIVGKFVRWNSSATYAEAIFGFGFFDGFVGSAGLERAPCC
jgi:hypothetical protein